MDVTYSKDAMQSGLQGERQHKHLRRAEVQKREKRVEKTMAARQSFLNSFNVSDHDKLYCISSGVLPLAPVDKDMMTAESLGKQAKITFITGRLDIKEYFLIL